MNATATQTTKAAYGLRHEPDKFHDWSLANFHVRNCAKPKRIMLGDDGRYWVVCPADADRLERAGLEYA